jgi:hypothetical protein
MPRDPIVEEVRAIRDAFAKRHNYDIDAIVQALRQASEKEGRQLVSLPAKRIEDADGRRKAG